MASEVAESAAESAALTAVFPAVPRDGFGEWLATTRHSSTPLDPEAKLHALLVYGLPAPNQRPKQPFPPFSEADLEAFRLQPLAAPTSSGAPSFAGAASSSALAASSSSAAAAAAPAGGAPPPKDTRFMIWELAHQVHDVYTNHWPHTWERPRFAADSANPQVGEYANYAEQLLKFPNCKKVLDGWRDAPETAPKTKQALTSLVGLLGRFKQELVQQKSATSRLSKASEAVQIAERNSRLFQEEMKLANKALEQRYKPIFANLAARLEALQNVRAAAKILERQEAVIEQTNLNFQWTQENAQLQHSHALEGQKLEAALQRAREQLQQAQEQAPPPEAAGGGSSAAEQPPPSKRRRA